MQSRGHGDKLARKCHEAVAALLTAPTIKAAAQQVGISEMALHAWLKIPAFAKLLREAQQQVFGHTLRRIQIESGQALDVIARVLRKKKGGNDGLKVRAALGLLGHGLKVNELVELAERLAAIESELARLDRTAPHTKNGHSNGKVRS
jgi:hypothetical protein